VEAVEVIGRHQAGDGVKEPGAEGPHGPGDERLGQALLKHIDLHGCLVKAPEIGGRVLGGRLAEAEKDEAETPGQKNDAEEDAERGGVHGQTSILTMLKIMVIPMTADAAHPASQA
jgi:hypothetical protein